MSDRTERTNVSLPQGLNDPAAFPARPERVVFIETHISWVFIAGDLVYKLKKPVTFPFLDYGTAELRRKACEDEVVVNSRLAPGVYLGVRPIVRQKDGRLHVDGEGELIDYCVEMKRLPDEDMLDHRIRAGTATLGDIHRLMDRLSPFYEHAERSPTVSAFATPEAILENTRGNLRVISQENQMVAPEVSDRLSSSQLQYLALHEALFRRRIAEGRIVDGHGDLKPEHVCLGEQLAVFDAIEFSPSLRAGDVVSELGFLAMECEFLRAPQLARAIFDEYRTKSGDDFPDHLAGFYQAYRAAVRAKVELLKAQQLTGDAARHHRAQAARYAQLASFLASGFHQTLLLVTVGAAGSGKSTLAAALAERIGASVLRTDVIRHELAGKREPDAAPGQGIYNAETTKQTYEETFLRAQRCATESISCVLDGSFVDARLRSQVRELAQLVGARCVFLYRRISPELAAQRIESRRSVGSDPSDARPEIHLAQAATLASADDLSDADVIVLEANESIESTVEAVLQQLTVAAMIHHSVGD